MDRCTGHCDITEILLKTALNTINQSNLWRHIVCFRCTMKTGILQDRFLHWEWGCSMTNFCTVDALCTDALWCSNLILVHPRHSPEIILVTSFCCWSKNRLKICSVWIPQFWYENFGGKRGKCCKQLFFHFPTVSSVLRQKSSFVINFIFSSAYAHHWRHFSDNT